MPPTKILIVLGVFFLAFAVDGLIPISTSFPSATLYQSTNWLRLLTARGRAVDCSSSISYFHQTVWEKWDNGLRLALW
jgi:hypothetical protein